jgi:restriction endonuclease S subunit
MMNFRLSSKVDRNKIFLVKKSNIHNRWDPFYSVPNIVELEESVQSVTSYKLRDFVVSMAGGATPLKSEADEHYTEGDSGIPFIRVQNLSTTGKLKLDDIKRITRRTHETLLARSKLSGGELLVKITGVGRMAIASVVPEGFEGNINQHIVAIRTKNIKTSKAIAAYLNLDVAEKIASRRSTGATRPALDYPAMLSIPVIFDVRIPEMIDNAIEKFDNEIRQSQEMFSRIDLVLLKELGVKTKPSNTSQQLQNNIFFSSLSKVSGERLDPLYHKGDTLDFVKESTFDFIELRRCVKYFQTGFAAGRNDQSQDGHGIIQIRPTNINDEREFVFDRNIYISKTRLVSNKDDLLENGEVLFNNTNSQFLVGKTVFFDLSDKYFCSNHITRIGVDENLLNPKYLYYLLNLYQRNNVFYKLCTNWNNQSGVSVDVLQRLSIPLPGARIQERIVSYLDNLKSESRNKKMMLWQNLRKQKKKLKLK